jgi:hypothetical protein
MGTNVLKECPASILRFKEYFSILKMEAEGNNLENYMMQHPIKPLSWYSLPSQL